MFSGKSKTSPRFLKFYSEFWKLQPHFKTQNAPGKSRSKVIEFLDVYIKKLNCDFIAVNWTAVDVKMLMSTL